MGITPEDVHNIAFSFPAAGKRGYRRQDVDAFLRRVEQALREHRAGRSAELSAGEIPGTAFRAPSWLSRGYNEDEVDATLDLCAAELRRFEEQSPAQNREPAESSPAPGGPASTAAEAPRIRTSTELQVARLNAAGPNEIGYAVRQVDVLRARMAAALDGANRLTSEDLANTGLRMARRPGTGYQPGSVDQLVRGVINELRHRGR